MPRHFHRMSNPQAAKNDDIGLTNTFVAFTHAIGLRRFFSFTPPIFDRGAWRAEHPKIDNQEEVDPFIVEEIWGGKNKDTKPSHKDLYK
jgi:hypothetical protein